MLWAVCWYVLGEKREKMSHLENIFGRKKQKQNTASNFLSQENEENCYGLFFNWTPKQTLNKACVNGKFINARKQAGRLWRQGAGWQ